MREDGFGVVPLDILLDEYSIFNLGDYPSCSYGRNPVPVTFPTPLLLSVSLVVNYDPKPLTLRPTPPNTLN